MTRCRASADHLDAILVDVRMSNEKKSLTCRCSDRNKPALTYRVIWIVEGDRKRIEKHRNSFFE